jgi:putative FmdB family regulatory protein
MPTYDYRCTKCGHVFELFHSIKDDAPKRCPKCRSKAIRVPAGGAGLLFKGSGFYITDYRSKAYKDKAKQEKGSGGGDTPKPEKSGGGDKPKPDKGSSGGAGGSRGKQGTSGD